MIRIKRNYLSYLLSMLLLTSLIGEMKTMVAAACLPSWSYRVPIVIENSSSQVLTDQQISIQLNTLQLISEGKMRSQGADIRFVDKNDELLSHWINESTYNSMNTEIWVKLSSLAANTKDTIYLFYGNASAPSTSDGEHTFLLFDDF